MTGAIDLGDGAILIPEEEFKKHVTFMTGGRVEPAYSKDSFDRMADRIGTLELDRKADGIRIAELELEAERLKVKAEQLEEELEYRRRDLEATALGMMVLGVINLGLILLHIAL